MTAARDAIAVGPPPAGGGDSGGRRGSVGAARWLGAAGIVGLGLAFGAVSPLLTVAAVCTLLFAWLTAARPLSAFLSLVLALLLIPVYVRVPLPAGLPALPPALAMMAVMAGVIGVRRFLAPCASSAHPPADHLRAAFLIFAGATLLSLADPASTIDSWNFWVKMLALPCMLFLLSLQVLRTPGDVDRALRTVLGAGLAATAYALVEFATGRNILLDWLLHSSGQETDIMYYTDAILASEGEIYRCFSLFDNPLVYGSFMGMIYPYPLVRFATARGPRERWAFGLGVAGCVLGVLLTFSRGALLAIVLCTLALALPLRPLRRWIAILGVGLLTAGLLAAPWLGGKLVARATESENVTVRLKLWQTAWTLFQEHPLLGVGLGNFPAYQLETIRRHRIGPFHEYGADGSLEKISTVENTFLQFAVETGLVGLGAALLLAGAVGSLLRRARRRDPEGQALPLAVLGGALSYFLNGMTITAYQHFTVTLQLGLYLSFAAVLGRARDG